METEPSAAAAEIDQSFPSLAARYHEWVRQGQFLFELETDGTIRYSNFRSRLAGGDLHAQAGTSVFEMTGIHYLSAFRRNFMGFVHGGKNRQTFQLRDSDGLIGAVIILTRSFYTAQDGQPSEVVLMELRGS